MTLQLSRTIEIYQAGLASSLHMEKEKVVFARDAPDTPGYFLRICGNSSLDVSGHDTGLSVRHPESLPLLFRQDGRPDETAPSFLIALTARI